MYIGGVWGFYERFSVRSQIFKCGIVLCEKVVWGDASSVPLLTVTLRRQWAAGNEEGVFELLQVIIGVCSAGGGLCVCVCVYVQSSA